MYCSELPEGKIFEIGDEVGDEWVDSPALIDAKEAVKSDQEVEVLLELENLRTAYMIKFGRKPHHKMKAESLKKALEDDS